MKAWTYIITWLLPIISILTMFQGDWSLVLIPVITFVIVPIAELLSSGVTNNYSKEETAFRRKAARFDWVIYMMVPLQVAVVTTMITLIATGHLQGWAVVGAVVSTGICCGSFGINIGHELGHRSKKYEQNLAKLMLLTTLYMHFFIEHNRGHHARVATDDDPASSKKGDLLYPFIFRSITQGWISAWKIEARRLRKHARPYLNLNNQMLRFQLIQLGTLAALLMVAGPLATVAFIGASFVGICLLETINYVEHYGLRRNQKANGRYERVQPHHSWNANHPLGRVLLYDLTRHSDHHANPGRKFSVLRHFDGAPQLPAGYPAMIILANIPPLWFKVMDPWLDKELERLEELKAA